MVKNCMTVLIVVLNTVLKMINVFVIEGIGYPRRGNVVATMVVGVFLSQYINTGLILTLAYANFAETPLFLIPVRNIYHDYTAEWYMDVGK